MCSGVAGEVRANGRLSCISRADYLEAIFHAELCLLNSTCMCTLANGVIGQFLMAFIREHPLSTLANGVIGQFLMAFIREHPLSTLANGVIGQFLIAFIREHIR